jgi:disease resistance protein RPM1
VDNGCGSRIITTSRVPDAAESSGEVLKLMPLSINSFKELFYATLCGCRGTINFDPLDEQTTEYIIQKCGYVPLAIIMIASLLAGKPQEEWTEVYSSIGFGQEDDIGDENNTRKIIQFSYYDLPSRPKTCLLHLSIFPDDHVIN